LSLKEAAAQETAKTTIVEKRQKRKALTTRKKTTLEGKSTDLGTRATKNVKLETTAQEQLNTKVDKQLVDEGFTLDNDVSEEDIEVRRKELDKELGSTVKMLQFTGESLADSSRYVNIAQNHPEIFGRNPDFNIIADNLAKYGDAPLHYQYLASQAEEGILTKLIDSGDSQGSELGLADAGIAPEQQPSYMARIAKEQADRLARKKIEEFYGITYDEILDTGVGVLKEAELAQ